MTGSLFYAPEEVPALQHRLPCANCNRATMAAEAVTELEYSCPWCLRMTVFNVRGGEMFRRLARDTSPENLQGPAKRDAFERMMKNNRGVDGHKC